MKPSYAALPSVSPWAHQRAVLAVIITTDAIKLSAVQALITGEGVACEVFDAQAGGLWRAIIPQRLMVDNEDLDRAKRVLRAAGFVEAADGDWDLKAGTSPLPPGGTEF